jgi:2-polyprenyl-3-methyl-5-hydroxy-6-metoxy-1,4-benzoquinol methylase
MSRADFQMEVKEKKRFEFGENWKKFLFYLDDQRVKEAENSIKEMLEVESLEGKTFLDMGSGSGLFSLAARNLGARVTSVDFDESSVWCTDELKRRFFASDDRWQVIHGSVLDKGFLSTLGRFDFVYSWGVLHHTGQMWQALANIVSLVREEDGCLFIALYNRQTIASAYWKMVKRTYTRFLFMRPVWIIVHVLYPTVPSLVLRVLKKKKMPRGMTVWYDLLDWLGGYPFEVSTPTEIFNFYKEKGFSLSKLKTVGGKLGCNEFVFRRNFM